MPVAGHPVTFEFREGALHIAHHHTAMKILAWPEPLALERNAKGDWVEFRPEMRLVKAEGRAHASPWDVCSPATSDEQLTREAFAAFRASMPAPIAVALERYPSHQWNLLELLSLKPQFLDLIRSNAAGSPGALQTTISSAS